MKKHDAETSGGPATVFLADPRCKMGKGLVQKTKALCQRVGLAEILSPGALVAVKLHWGEPGNVAFLSPVLVGAVCEEIEAAGARPFLTDTSTLYRGGRSNAVASLLSAARNGFSPFTVHAPVIVADGLRGTDGRPVDVPRGKHVKTARIAGAVVDADAIVVLSHVKGHELFGLGGALKNLGMGCATAAGKQTMHSDLRPAVNRDRCVGCGRCVANCPVDAISLAKGKASIASKTCIGCGECTVACPAGAIPSRWKTDERPLLEKTAEFAWASLDGKRERAVFLNFMINMAPQCDCYGHNDLAVTPDLGITASRDPVAIDQAAYDLFNAAPVVAGSDLAESERQGDNAFRLHGIHWEMLLEHASALGMGTRRYDLVRVDGRAGG